jgi:hypothetical protein
MPQWPVRPWIIQVKSVQSSTRSELRRPALLNIIDTPQLKIDSQNYIPRCREIILSYIHFLIYQISLFGQTGFQMLIIYFHY